MQVDYTLTVTRGPHGCSATVRDGTGEIVAMVGGADLESVVRDALKDLPAAAAEALHA